VLHTLVAEPPAVQRARELGVWLIESKRKAVTLEETLRTANGQVDDADGLKNIPAHPPAQSA
jgi:hypothetical protein